MSLYDDASLIAYPSGYKESKIYSLKPTDGTGDLTFARASTATRVNAEGLIETASVIGSELVTNGDFATNTGWYLSGSTAISGGKLNLNFSGGNGAYQVVNFTSGSTSKVVVTCSAYTSGSIGLRVGSTSNSGLINGVGIYTFYIPESAYTYVNFFSSVGFIGSIDNVSVKEVITSNIPRIDYSNGCGSLLLEPLRTNFMTYSEDFSNAAWEKGAGGTASAPIVSANQGISPDGTNNAFKVELNLNGGSTSSDRSRLTDNFTGVTSTDYTFSFYAKAYSSSDVGKVVKFAVDNSSGDALFTLTSEWKRFVFVGLSSNTNINQHIQLRGNENTSDSVAMLLYGYQAEQGSYETSLINTSGTTVTRVTDESSTTGLSSVIGQTEGVLYAKIASFTNTSPISSVINISDGSASNQIAIWYGTNLNEFKILIRQSGNKLFHTTTLTDATQFIKVAVLYKSGGSKVYINGSLITSSTTTFTFTNPLSIVDFVGIGLGNADFNGKLQELQIFPSALDDATLATLTTL